MDSVLIRYNISQMKNSGVPTYHERTITRMRVDARISFLMECWFRLENSFPRNLLCFVRIGELLRRNDVEWNIFLRGLIFSELIGIFMFLISFRKCLRLRRLGDSRLVCEGGNRVLIYSGQFLAIRENVRDHNPVPIRGAAWW